MALGNQTARELKGFGLAVVAGLVFVGLSFAAGALIRAGQSATPPPSPVESTAKSPVGTSQTYSPQMITTGKQLFGHNCASCHGASAQGAYGPKLHNLSMPDSRIAAIITNGKGQMPAFGKQLNGSQINDIVGYLRSLK